MINARLDWNGNQAETSFREAAWEAIRRGAHFYWERLQDALNVPNPGQRVKGRSGKSRTIYPSPSKPGEPPRKRTGFLAANVLEDFDEINLVARVGVTRNALYGVFLELGTKFMQARPWLLATLNKFMAQITATIGYTANP